MKRQKELGDPNNKQLSAKMTRRIVNELKNSSKTIRDVKEQLDLKVSRATIGRVIKKSS